MDTQETRTITHPGLTYCTCCTPRQLLIPRDDIGAPGRWAVCITTGNWYENRGDGLFLPTAAPRDGDIVATQPTDAVARQRADQWTGGDALPAIVPGVRIDLSKESYA